MLEPLDIDSLIPPDHAARNVWDLLGRMDLSRFAGEIKSIHGHAGRNAWEPLLLIAMWIYAIRLASLQPGRSRGNALTSLPFGG